MKVIKVITKSKGLLSNEWLAGYAIWPQTPWQQYCNSKQVLSNLAEKDWPWSLDSFIQFPLLRMEGSV